MIVDEKVFNDYEDFSSFFRSICRNLSEQTNLYLLVNKKQEDILNATLDKHLSSFVKVLATTGDESLKFTSFAFVDGHRMNVIQVSSITVPLLLTDLKK